MSFFCYQYDLEYIAWGNRILSTFKPIGVLRFFFPETDITTAQISHKFLLPLCRAFLPRLLKPPSKSPRRPEEMSWIAYLSKTTLRTTSQQDRAERTPNYLTF